MMFQIDDSFRTAHPEAHAGVLVMRGAVNPTNHAGLQKRKEALEARLRERFSALDRPALLNVPELRAYDAYYRPFKKTYHIRLQLESIVFKGKSLPAVAALVESMFMAEMEDLLLTAGHDLDSLRLPLSLCVARGDEAYTLMRGGEQTLKAGDMFIRDGEGVISSVIYGPDRRTQLRPETRNVAFTTYAPKGIDPGVVTRHLGHIEENVRCFSPEAEVEVLEVFGDENAA
jgi:DNA/RNA-binding domain of Phe-tRNA-synthetase-like protein